jgi:hypothetical protein
MEARRKGRGLQLRWARRGTFLFFLLGGLLASSSLAQPPLRPPDPAKKTERPTKERAPKKGEDPLQLPFSDFWEKEGELWGKTVRLIEALRQIDDQLLPLERKKEEVVSTLRDLRRRGLPQKEEVPHLRVLSDLMKSIQPLAAKRTQLTAELSPLLESWNLLQSQALPQLEREGGKFKRAVAEGVINRFVAGFQKGDSEAISKLLLRGAQVNGRWDQKGYERHLADLFAGSQVQEFRIPNWTLREVNPYTLRVEGRYSIKIAEKPKGSEKAPPPQTKEDNLIFEIREVSDEWLITNLMGSP